MKFSPSILFCSLIFFLTATYANCTVVDDAGQTFTITNPAQHIVSLAPDITEILFATGAGSHVVGVIAGSDYPVRAKQLPQVGSYSGIDLERLLSLHPDFIVVWNHTYSRQLAALKKFNIPIYKTNPKRLEDIPITMLNMGCIAGTQRQANASAEKFRQRLNTLQTRYQMQKPLTVFYQLGAYSLLTINKTSWINQAITFCGGRNIFAEALTITPEVSWEAVVTANPEVIMSDATTPQWQDRWQKWTQVQAVKNQHLYSVNPDWMDRAGPRLVDGVEQMCKIFEQVRG